MSPTDCVDALDVPVRTLEQMDREQADRIAALQAGWLTNSSKVTGCRDARTAIPTADQMNRTLRKARGNKAVAARLYGVQQGQFQKWLVARGIAEQWKVCRSRPVYSSKGHKWDTVELAAKAVGIGPSAVRECIRRAGFTKGLGLDYQPFPGVKYE